MENKKPSFRQENIQNEFECSKRLVGVEVSITVISETLE